MNNYFTNPKAPTLAKTYSSSVSSSNAVTLNSGTTYILVSAVGKGIFLKWGAVASSSSFDEFISTDSTQEYLVPTGTTSVQFIEEATSAHLVVIEK